MMNPTDAMWQRRSVERSSCVREYAGKMTFWTALARLVAGVVSRDDARSYRPRLEIPRSLPTKTVSMLLIVQLTMLVKRIFVPKPVRPLDEADHAGVRLWRT